MRRVMQLALALALASAAAGAEAGDASASCPGGWQLFQGNCFRSSCGYSAVSFFQAQQSCQGLNPNASLASVLSQEEQDFIVNSMTGGCPAYYYQSFWLGLERACPMGPLVWVDSGAPANYTAWSSPPSSQGNLCASVDRRYGGSGLWSATSCGSTSSVYGAICKAPATLGGLEELSAQRQLAAASAQCDAEWCSLGDYCYRTYLGVAGSSGAEWEVARDFCRAQGGDLTSVHSYEESNFTNTMASLTPENRRQVWHGLNQVDALDEDFVWSDGSPVDFLNWTPGQPDSSNRFGVESCGQFFNNYALPAEWRGLWNDDRCDAPQPFVCKKAAHGFTPPVVTTAKPPQGGCPAGWHRFRRRCFLFQNQSLGFEDANKACQATGANHAALTSVRDVYDQLFVQQLSAQAMADPWIGLYAGSDGHVIWSNEDHLRYTHWAGGSFRSGEGCAALSTATGFWQWTPYGDCNGALKRPFVCEAYLNSSLPVQPPPTRKPCGASDSNCLQLFPAKTSWTQAGSNCAAALPKAFLASFQTYAAWDQAVLMGLGQGLTTFWTGLNDRGRAGDFVNSDGWPASVVEWAPGEPSAGHHCVAMELSPKAQSGAWLRALDCASSLPSLCKAGVGAPPTPATKGRCPQGWFKGSSVCYKVFAEQSMSYSDAHLYCERLSTDSSGGLAAFTSPADLQSLLFDVDVLSGAPRFFIGLDKTAAQGWRWDNRPASYFNWAPGQPVNVTERASCAQMDPKGLWYAVSCLQPGPFVCQIAKGPLTTPTPSGSQLWFASPEIPRLQVHPPNTNIPRHSKAWQAQFSRLIHGLSPRAHSSCL